MVGGWFNDPGDDTSGSTSQGVGTAKRVIVERVPENVARRRAVEKDLREQNRHQQQRIIERGVGIRELTQENGQLAQENEQLKKQLNDLTGLVRSMPPNQFGALLERYHPAPMLEPDEEMPAWYSFGDEPPAPQNLAPAAPVQAPEQQPPQPPHDSEEVRQLREQLLMAQNANGFLQAQVDAARVQAADAGEMENQFMEDQNKIDSLVRSIHKLSSISC
jgi:hypothetical protein